MPEIFFDTHAHLDYPDFATELIPVVERASGAGISRIITIGTDLESSRRSIQIAEQFPNVFAVVGWHPSYAMNAPADLRPALRELASHPKVVALGETGLDYHRLPSASLKSKVQSLKSSSSAGDHTMEDEQYKAKQAELFRQHLEVAKETGLNCVIHQRDSMEDTISLLQPFASSVRGVFHCFANDAVTMRRILALNSLVSFTGIVTFKKWDDLALLRLVPDDRLLVESDSPYLAPVPHRGKRNEPSFVPRTIERLAVVRGTTTDALAELTASNARRLFGLAMVDARP